jgi:hypothetical protein
VVGKILRTVGGDRFSEFARFREPGIAARREEVGEVSNGQEEIGEGGG